MEDLKQILVKTETFFPHFDKKKNGVSHVNIGWHIEHVLLVINGVSKQLEMSNPSEYKTKFNFNKWIVFTFKKIPRGRGKAPRKVNPDYEITKEGLERKLMFAKENIEKINGLDDKSFFQHPLFGKVNKKESIKFLVIHTEHHIKIIEDILK